MSQLQKYLGSQMSIFSFLFNADHNIKDSTVSVGCFLFFEDSG